MAFVKGEHPRLYFSRDDLARLRERSKIGVSAEILAILTAFCDRMVDPKDEHYFNVRKQKKPLERGIVEASLVYLSLAYAFTGEKCYGEAARDAAVGMIQGKLAEDFRHGLRGSMHAIQDKGWYALAICTAYDVCYDLFDDEQRKLFIAHALENIDLAENPEVFFNDARFLMNNRGMAAFIGCFGFYPLALEGETKFKHDEYLNEAINAAEVYLHMAFDQDGVSYEGPAYGKILGFVYCFARMLQRSGRTNLLRNSRFEQYVNYMLYEMLPGGYACNNLNDADESEGTVGPSLLLMGTKRGAVIPWLARQLDLHPRRMARNRKNLIDHFETFAVLCTLLEWDDSAPVRTPEELGYPLSRLFPQRGIASMRTGWGDQDILISHRCGFEMYTMHKQSDQNHLALYALGEKFLVDEGYGHGEHVVPNDQKNHPNWRYYGAADVHNTVLFDGLDQRGNQRTTGWAEGRIIDWQHTDEFDTSLGDAAGAYGPDHTIDRALRRVVFVRDTAHPFVIVIDNMVVDPDGREHDFEALWRTAPGNQIKVNGKKFTILGKQNDCHCVVLYPSDAELKVVTHYNLPQLRAKTRTVRFEMVTVLAPGRRSEEAPSFSLERHDEGDFTITVKDGAAKHIIRAGTQTEGPLRSAMPVEYRALKNE